MRPPRDVSPGFIKQLFEQQIAKPYRQLRGLGELWPQLVPADLLPHTSLQAFNRGVLRVGVDSSARLYELDRLLRQGLLRQLISAFKAGSLRSVKLVLVPASADAASRAASAFPPTAASSPAQDES